MSKLVVSPKKRIFSDENIMVRESSIVDLDVRAFVCQSADFPFILSLNEVEQLKVTTLLASNIRSSPVEGFLPLRCFLSLTQNLPNPDIRTSSPVANVDLIFSNRFSITLSEPFFVGQILAIDSMRWFFVRDIKYGSFQEVKSSRRYSQYIKTFGKLDIAGFDRITAYTI